MQRISKTLIGLASAAMLTVLSGTGYAQAVETPYSPSETGPALSAAEEAALVFGPSASVDCVTPYSPNECGPAEQAAVGGVIAQPLTGTVSFGASDGSPFPDAGSGANTIDD